MPDRRVKAELVQRYRIQRYVDEGRRPDHWPYRGGGRCRGITPSATADVSVSDCPFDLRVTTTRRVPAVALARRLVEQGRIGEIRHVRAQYLQDWLADPEAPLSWRLQKERAGSGALGDIGAHIIDLTQTVPMLHQALVKVSDTVAGGADRRSSRGCKVDALMPFPAPRNRMLAH